MRSVGGNSANVTMAGDVVSTIVDVEAVGAAASLMSEVSGGVGLDHGEVTGEGVDEGAGK